MQSSSPIAQEKLETLASEWGADLVGFCALDASPIQDLPELRYAISIAVKLSDAVLKTIEILYVFSALPHGKFTA